MREAFLYVLNTGIMAGWLVLAVVAMRLLLKKAPAWIKCALWAIVALRLVWPFEIESILSLIPSAETLPPAELYNYTPQLDTGFSSVNAVVNPVFTDTFTSEPFNSVNPLQVAVELASAVWFIGLVAMVIYTAVSYQRLRRRVRVSMPVGENVYLCDHISSPFILGVFRPRIYLPSGLPEEKWESILAHERAHLARRDHWWKPLGFTLLTVFWFHPLLWLAYILLCRDVELACDEKVIASLSSEEKQAYSEVLLECSMPKRWITACPLAFGETGVKQRIKAVLHYKKPTLWIIIAALIAGSVLAVCFLTEPKANNQIVITKEDIAGKSYIYEGIEDPLWEFVIHIQEDGTFTYYEGVLSSYIGHGTWELIDGKLHLYDEGLSQTRTFVFEAKQDALVFCADESDRFTYTDVVDGERFFYFKDIESNVQHLIYVDVVKVESDYFIGKDVLGKLWRIQILDPQYTFNLRQCWVTYYGEPKVLEGEEAQYEVKATDCWQYRDNISQVRFNVYDYLMYDIDGDGVDEACILVPYLSATSWLGDDYECTLLVYDGENREYVESFYQLQPIQTGYLSVTMDPAYRLREAYAFVFVDGKLHVATPNGTEYVSTGVLKLFEVQFENSELRIVEVQ